MENVSELYTLLHSDIPTSEKKTIIDIKTIAANIDTLHEDCLCLVNDLVRKHKLDTIDPEGKNYPLVRKFCLDYIKRQHPFVFATQIRKDYNEDYQIQASFKHLDMDPDKFWYLLLFCIFYVDSIMKRLIRKSPPVRKQLESFVDNVSKMNFDDKNWMNSAPKLSGTLSFCVDELNETKITIKDPYAIHLIASLINDYLNLKHDNFTNLQLDKEHPVLSGDEMYKFGKMSHVKIPFDQLSKPEELTEEQKAFYNLVLSDPYERYDKSEVDKIRLFKELVFDYINTASPTTKCVKDFFPDYDGNDNVKVTVSKWFLLSKLIYRLKYLRLQPKGNESKEKRSKSCLYNDPDFLKNYLK